MSNLFLVNPQARQGGNRGLFKTAEYQNVNSFYDSHPEIESTTLHWLPDLASRLGIGELLVKDESSRFGLPAFKVMGVMYAVSRLFEMGRIDRSSTLVCATSGNHGRAVARVAGTLGLKARVYVPHDAVSWRIEAIKSEGAEVIVSDGIYSEAVRQAVEDASRFGWQVISDTSYEGYEEIPKLIMAGYSRVIEESSRQWKERPDVVLVQGGVGGLVCAAVSWMRHRYGSDMPFFICCEPLVTACLLESTRAGKPITIQGDFNTKMEGLRCSEVSPLAWRTIRETVDAFIAVDDAIVFETMRLLAHPEGGDPLITAGASGACGLAVLRLILKDETLRKTVGLNQDSRVMVINTEGATDPELYRSVTGTDPASSK